MDMTKRGKIIWAALGLLLVAAVGWAAFGSGSPVAVTTTDTVKRADLVQTVEITGDVQSVDEVDLAFDRSGTVEAVLARVGDAVRAGDVLAVLDADELEAAYAQAVGRVEEAEANLALKRAGVSVEERAVSEADVLVAEAALAAARSDAEHVASVADADVASAESDLAATTDGTADDLAQAQEDLVESLRSVVSEARSALSDADTVLGVENTLYNQAFDDVLSNTDAQALIAASNAFEIAAASRDAAEDALLAMDESAFASVNAVADAAKQAYEDAYETLLQTSRVLDATSADSSDFSLDDLDALKATISAATSSLVTDGGALTNARQAYADALRATVDDVRDAENAVASAKAARERDVAKAAAAVASREADLARAEAALSNATATPRAVDLASYEAAVTQAEADALSALARLRDTQVIAPIDGILTAVDVDPGESVTAGTGVVTVLSAGLDFEIALDIPESDVAKTREGQAADVTFDAFGDDLVFGGTLFSIDPAQKLIEGVVFYEAKVLLDPDQDLSAVKPGMSADVTVVTGERTGVLTVPSRAVLERDGQKYVRVPSGDAYEERAVTVGLRADGGTIEITSGLSEGETVIVSIRPS